MVSLADVTGGSLSLQAPDDANADAATLTLTVSSSEGGNTTSASQPLTVTATAIAEAPTFGGASTSAATRNGNPITLSGITVSSVDSDDTLGGRDDHGVPPAGR